MNKNTDDFCQGYIKIENMKTKCNPFWIICMINMPVKSPIQSMKEQGMISLNRQLCQRTYNKSKRNSTISDYCYGSRLIAHQLIMDFSKAAWWTSGRLNHMRFNVC